MEIKGTAKLLRIFVGESDKVSHTPLYEVIVKTARERHLAGATAWRGILGFGAAARMRTTKLLDLSRNSFRSSMIFSRRRIPEDWSQSKRWM
jgi:PII-like signaling protein